ncbi:MAG TPA: hypothetical protein VIQ00_04775 [Chitinophagaceae bacterium]
MFIQFRILFFLSITALSAPAQDISGFWKGTLNMPSSCFSVNNIELQIKKTGNELFGNSYHYQDIDYYVKKNFRGLHNDGSMQIIIQEGDVTTFKIPNSCIVCIKKYELVYSREGDKETLSGTWTGKIEGTNLDCSTGPITLSRIKESAFKEIPEIEVDTGQLRLDFYDNGTVDGDSITVRVNKNIVLSHQKLSAKPVTLFFNIDLENTFQEIEMVAENLGSIPPNTALLIITAGEKRYRLFLSSTETKSARVRFVYDKR